MAGAGLPSAEDGLLLLRRSLTTWGLGRLAERLTASTTMGHTLLKTAGGQLGMSKTETEEIALKRLMAGR